MLINEAGKKAKLTKKAIEYYTQHELIFPAVLDNGYRDFSESDVERLTRISVLRKLGLDIQEIKSVLADDTGNTLKGISIRKELNLQREKAKKIILDKLSCGASYSEIGADLNAIEQNATVTEKLLDAFPGYYGRFVCLHFARFLNEPIVAEEQHQAYKKIIDFLDNMPSLDFPEDFQTFFDENVMCISVEHINGMLENTKHSIENPEAFLSEHKEEVERYLEFRQSEEYKNSPLYKMKEMLKEFNSTSGYYSLFIPEMKKLSKSYAEYSKEMDIANEKFLSQYPEFE